MCNTPYSYSMHNQGGSGVWPGKRVSLGFLSSTFSLENGDTNFSIKSEHLFTNDTSERV